MGALYDDLEGHEGYPARRLPDGTLTASWTAATAEFSAYIAACACGWYGTAHPPTEEGNDSAIDEWDELHARPLLALAVPVKVTDLMRELCGELSQLANDCPEAAVKAAQELAASAEATLARVLPGAHRVAGVQRRGDDGRRVPRLGR